MASDSAAAAVVCGPHLLLPSALVAHRLEWMCAAGVHDDERWL